MLRITSIGSVVVKLTFANFLHPQKHCCMNNMAFKHRWKHSLWTVTTSVKSWHFTKGLWLLSQPKTPNNN